MKPLLAAELEEPKIGVTGKGLKEIHLLHLNIAVFIFFHSPMVLPHLEINVLKRTVGKRRNAGISPFFHNVFAPLKTEIIILATFNILSANAFKLD